MSRLATRPSFVAQNVLLNHHWQAFLSCAWETGLSVKLLVVDDDPLVVEDLRVLLPGEIELEWAPGSAEALAFLRMAELPTAIVLDLCLPAFLAESAEQEGLELLKELRSGHSSGTPVIVLSAAPRTEMEAICLELGAVAYLEKPCPIRDLLRHLPSPIRDSP